MKIFSIITIAILIFAAVPALAEDVGSCVCDFTMSGILITGPTGCSGIPEAQCNWNSGASNCGCMGEIRRSVTQEDCFPDAAGMISATYGITSPTYIITGSCSWTPAPSTGEETGETPSTGAGTPPRLEFEPPLGTTDVNELIGYIIRAVTGIVGSIALLMFVAGGFVWMTAAGNEERVKLGKNILIWSTLGLVVIFSAYAVTRYILTALLE
ncbi:MAG: pilin [Patescibacteria group bacterium]|nr:pilin [Patescibacteria group bacterium]